MDKHTQAKLVWGFFATCFLLSCWSLCKAWINGEITRTNRSNRSVRTIRRDNNPSEFNRYFTGVVLINICFFVFLIVLGVFAFLR
jgi:hypothetical protein